MSNKTVIYVHVDSFIASAKVFLTLANESNGQNYNKVPRNSQTPCRKFSFTFNALVIYLLVIGKINLHFLIYRILLLYYLIA